MTTLTETERLLLMNQYEILSQSSNSEDDKKHFHKLLTIVKEGLAGEYWQLTDILYDEFDAEECTRVQNILSMFLVLRCYAEDNNIDPIRFLGFDGNKETYHKNYTHFLATCTDRWQSVLGNECINSHVPVLQMYESMLTVWETALDRQHLTEEEYQKIVETRGFISQR